MRAVVVSNRGIAGLHHTGAMSADGPEKDAARPSWIRRHLRGAIIGVLVLIVLIAGVIGLVRISNEVKGSYAIEYGDAISAEDYSAMVRAVVSETGNSDVFAVAIEHVEAATSDMKVPDLTISVTTGPTTSHPFGASWEWRGGALRLVGALGSDDVPAGDGVFALGSVSPETLNAVDRRVRATMPHGVTQATLTVQRHGDTPVIRVSARNRGTDDTVDARATAAGRIIDGTVCLATDHPRGQPVRHSCRAVE